MGWKNWDLWKNSLFYAFAIWWNIFFPSASLSGVKKRNFAHFGRPWHSTYINKLSHMYYVNSWQMFYASHTLVYFLWKIVMNFALGKIHLNNYNYEKGFFSGLVELSGKWSVWWGKEVLEGSLTHNWYRSNFVETVDINLKSEGSNPCKNYIFGKLVPKISFLSSRKKACFDNLILWIWSRFQFNYVQNNYQFFGFLKS